MDLSGRSSLAHATPAAGKTYVAPRRSSAAPEDEDRKLVLRLAQRDSLALAALYDRWSPLIYGLALRMLNDADEAEEVLSETFWQAWNQAEQYASLRGSVTAWLTMIARSRALDRLRSRRRSREGPLSDTRQVADERTSGADATPLAHAEQDQRRAIVLRALDSLPAEQREAVELAYFGGFSQSEIAARTHQPLGTIKTRIRLALLKLREPLLILADGA